MLICICIYYRLSTTRFATEITFDNNNSSILYKQMTSKARSTITDLDSYNVSISPGINSVDNF